MLKLPLDRVAARGQTQEILPLWGRDRQRCTAPLRAGICRLGGADPPLRQDSLESGDAGVTADDQGVFHPSPAGQNTWSTRFRFILSCFGSDSLPPRGCEPVLEPGARTLCRRSDRARALGYIRLSDRGYSTRRRGPASHRAAARHHASRELDFSSLGVAAGTDAADRWRADAHPLAVAADGDTGEPVAA